jgi:hypothetical protein
VQIHLCVPAFIDVGDSLRQRRLRLVPDRHEYTVCRMSGAVG